MSISKLEIKTYYFMNVQYELAINNKQDFIESNCFLQIVYCKLKRVILKIS